MNAPTRRLAPTALTVLTLVCAAAPDAAAQFTLDDSLRGSATHGHAVGGSFGPDGWTVTDRTDRMWFELPRLVSGAIQFTVTGITPDNLNLADHELFAMYEAGYGMVEPLPYSPEYRNNHYKCMIRVYGWAELDEARRGQQKLMWGMCPSGAPGYDECGCEPFFEEPFGGDGTWDGSPQTLRVEWGAGHTRYLRNGGVVLDIDWSESGLTFGPSVLHFSLGTPRPTAVGDAGMPVGAVFSDVHVEGTEGDLAVCPGTAADADADADAELDVGPDADADVPVEAEAEAATDAELPADDAAESVGDVADVRPDVPVVVEEDGGCGCRAIPAAGGPAWLLLLVGLIGLLHRRR